MKRKYYIVIGSKKHEVNREIHKVYQKYEKQLKYSEYNRKTEKIEIDSSGKIKIKPSKEDSLERLLNLNTQIPDTRNSSVQDLIEMKIMLDYALNCLPESDKTLIDKLYFQGYSVSELAKIMNVSVVAIYKRRDKILYNLNKILSK